MTCRLHALLWTLVAVALLGGCRIPGDDEHGEGEEAAEAAGEARRAPGQVRLTGLEVGRRRTDGGEALHLSAKLVNGTGQPVPLRAHRVRVACLIDEVQWVDLAGDAGPARTDRVPAGGELPLSVFAFRDGMRRPPAWCDVHWTADIDGHELLRAHFCWKPDGVEGSACERPRPVAEYPETALPLIYPVEADGGGHAMGARFGLRAGTFEDALSMRVAFVCDVAGRRYRQTARPTPLAAFRGVQTPPERALAPFEASGLIEDAPAEAAEVRVTAFAHRTLPAVPSFCDVTAFVPGVDNAPPERLACLRWEMGVEGATTARVCPDLPAPQELTAEAIEIADVRHAVRPARGGHFVALSFQAAPTVWLPAGIGLTAELTCGDRTDTFRARETDGLWAPGQWQDTRASLFPPHRGSLDAPPEQCALRVLAAASDDDEPVVVGSFPLRGAGTLEDVGRAARTP